MRALQRSFAGGLHGGHRGFVPRGFIGGAPDHGGRDPVVTFSEDRGRDLDLFAHQPFYREAAVVDGRSHAFDRHARRRDHRFDDRFCGRCAGCSVYRRAARGTPVFSGTALNRKIPPGASVNGSRAWGAVLAGASSAAKRVRLPGTPPRKLAGSDALPRCRGPD